MAAMTLGFVSAEHWRMGQVRCRRERRGGKKPHYWPKRTLLLMKWISRPLVFLANLTSLLNMFSSSLGASWPAVWGPLCSVSLFSPCITFQAFMPMELTPFWHRPQALCEAVLILLPVEVSNIINGWSNITWMTLVSTLLFRGAKLYKDQYLGLIHLWCYPQLFIILFSYY